MAISSQLTISSPPPKAHLPRLTTQTTEADPTQTTNSLLHSPGAKLLKHLLNVIRNHNDVAVTTSSKIQLAFYYTSSKISKDDVERMVAELAEAERGSAPGVSGLGE